MKRFLPVLALLVCSTAAAASNGEQRLTFASLLDESGLVYQPPSGFREVPVEPNSFRYEKRLVHEQEALEIRYSIRPLARIEIDYEDPHNSAPHPNDLFDMLFRSLSEDLARGANTLNRAYAPDQARELFNAGWAAVSVFDLSEGVAPAYGQGLLVAIHRNDLADAYILFLTNQLDAHRQLINDGMRSLAFEEFPGR